MDGQTLMSDVMFCALWRQGRRLQASCGDRCLNEKEWNEENSEKNRSVRGGVVLLT